MIGVRWKQLGWLAAGLLSVGAGFWLSFTGIVRMPRFSIAVVDLRPASVYQPSYAATEGTELVMIYIGSSNCGPSNDPDLFKVLDELKLELRDRAHAEEMGFTTIGIAKDWKVDAGIDHLRRAGPFDEIMAGRNWLGIGLLHYLWQDIPGIAATPQIVVVRRELHVRRHGAPGSYNGVEDELLLIRKVGLQEIIAWKDLGVPLPPAEASVTRNNR